MSNTLQETATLVRLTAKHWSGIKVDERLTDNLASTHGVTNQEAIKVSKKILGKDCNKYFRRILNQFRNDWFYPMTTAWSDTTTEDGKSVSGWRLCPNSKLDELQDKVNEAKEQWDREVRGFINQYDNNVAEAKHILGSAYNPLDYPNKDELIRKFKFDWEINLIPTGSNDIRLNVSEAMMTKIQADTERRVQANVEGAIKESIGGLVDLAEHLADSLAGYDPKNKIKSPFRDSGFDKLRQKLENLPQANEEIFGGIKEVNQAHQKLVGVMSKINDIDSLRDDSDYAKTKRETISQGLKEASSDLNDQVLGSMFGGGKDD